MTEDTNRKEPMNTEGEGAASKYWGGRAGRRTSEINYQNKGRAIKTLGFLGLKIPSYFSSLFFIIT